ncbi:MAG: alpha-L-fucosidase [Sedimentisphaerales bacterium]|nr:alpha-L-fucosidase [Sedimentisphaerales bacterium]
MNGMEKLAVIIIVTLLYIGVSFGAEIADDELASMEKANTLFKSRDGIVCPGLRLTEEDMAQWRGLKFGMFIHWGLYAIPGQGEWVMYNQKIPADEYVKLADEFNSQRFDADQWAQIAKDAGMKYMVLTARHHDGFCLWDSPSSYKDFTSVKTAAKRDFVKEYVQACRDAGLKVGIYYSLMDWRFPGYFKPKELQENALLMKEQCWGQVEELCTRYGPIDILWYDGGWLAHQGTDADGAWLWGSVKLNQMVRKYNPKTVINPRSGWEGDFNCNEGGDTISGPIIPFPWEKCLNLNKVSWGYQPKQNLMGYEEIINMLLDIFTRDGNVLLNVGPDADGVIPPAHVQRLRQVGKWMAEHAESIYGTRGGPFQPTEHYGSTHKGNKIYVHIRNWPQDGTITLPAIAQTIQSSSILTGGKVSVQQDEKSILIEVPLVDRRLLDTVVILELDKPVTAIL